MPVRPRWATGRGYPRPIRASPHTPTPTSATPPSGWPSRWLSCPTTAGEPAAGAISPGAVPGLAGRETDRDRPRRGGLDPGQEAGQRGLRHGDLDGFALGAAAQDYPVGRQGEALGGRGLAPVLDR